MDEVNAMLSFVYSLLAHDVASALEGVGLDPAVGFLHRDRPGRPSLALDLMEEFRPLVVDRVMLGLVRAGVIQPGDFTATNRKERPVELGEALMPKVIEAYEQRLSSTIVHTPSNTQTMLRRCLELQARLYARVVVGERSEYEGVIG